MYRFLYPRSTIRPGCIVFLTPEAQFDRNVPFSTAGAQVPIVQPNKFAVRVFSIPRANLFGCTIGFRTVRPGPGQAASPLFMLSS